jgi:hypothetical protein
MIILEAFIIKPPYDHIESLHPWSATAIIYKGIEGGLK